MSVNTLRAGGAIAIACAGMAFSSATWTQESESQSSPRFFEVTVTNLTRGQQFTPILVASHRAGIRLFELGEPASASLQTIAEEGDVAPLAAELTANPDVLEVTNSGALLDPGASVSIRVRTQGNFNGVSIAAMLIPTNDGFFALNGAWISPDSRSRTFTSVAYDAGSERNDELCASIPGPSFDECGGPGGGGMPAGDEEGYVHVHAGIHDVGDFDPADRDWRNPVARIVVRRVH
ncbi:MAG: spondin domain-containing protein [Steroidobacteraceae bacterium]